MGGLPTLLRAVARTELALDRRITPLAAAVLLALVIGGACAVAVLWGFLVPIYQGPDEILNDDYSFSVLRAGHLLNARDLPPGNAHPYTRYLADRTGGERMPFQPLVKAPPGYGTPAYFAALDAGRPGLDTAPDHTPYLVTRYPFGYFSVVALWLGTISILAGSGPVTLFFAARLLSVVMLAGTLAMTYGIARELGVSRLRTLALTAAIGFFPMTTFVASYAQADNLSWLLVSATWLVSLRSRNRGLGHLAALGLLLGALLVTKYQFFICTAIPVVALVGLRRRRWSAADRRWPLVGALITAPAVFLGAVQYWVGYGSPFPLIGSSRENTAFWTDQALLTAVHSGPVAIVRYAGHDLLRALIDYFGGGPTFRGFWGEFGWSDTVLVIRSRTISSAIRGMLLVLTVLLVVLAVYRLCSNARRLWRLRRAGRGHRALQILGADPATGTYLLFVLFMLSFYVFTDDSFFAQGRNWIPVILPVFGLGILLGPRALPRRLAPVVSVALLAGLLLYSAVASHYAITTLKERYYGNGRVLVAATLPGNSVSAGDIEQGIDYVLPASLKVRPGEPLAIGGWAGSARRADGVLAVFVSIDGSGAFEAVYGDSRDDVVGRTGNPNFGHAGFDLIVPTEGLAPGSHTLTLKIVPRDRSGYFQPAERRTFTVAGG